MADPNHIRWLLQGVESWNQRRARDEFEPDFRGADLYKEYYQAGKLDDNGNIPLVGIDLRGAGLSDSRLCSTRRAKGADLQAARLERADFRNSYLRNSILDDARLGLAKLSGANCHATKFRRAKMWSTRLREADLSQADLSNAELGINWLGGTNLSSATLVDTDLSQADLTETTLGWSRFWEAKLFRGSQSALMAATSVGNGGVIKSIAELVQRCMQMKGVAHSDRVLYFRGESNDGWELRPSVMRTSPGDRSLLPKEGEMLLELMARRPEDFSGATSALAQWVLAQHHGLRTRLLDVTRNPLVALFTACRCGDRSGRIHAFAVPRELVKPFNSDTISVVASFAKLSRAEQNELVGWSAEDVEAREETPHYGAQYKQAMRRLYQLIRQDKPYFEERIDPRHLMQVFVVEPQQYFERVRVQSGAFLISAFHERFECPEVLKWNRGIPIYDHTTFEVPEKKKTRILEELALFNITRDTLFPGLDEAAEAVTKRHTE